MPLTNAEKQARWRQRQRENEVKHSEYKRKERERYQQKKERGVVLTVSEMNEREKRRKRRQWRKAAKEKRAREKQIIRAIDHSLTPPTSPELVMNRQQQVARELGRRKVRKDRAKAYREIFKLRVALKREARLKEKYKKRSARLGKKLNKSITKPVKDIMKNHDLRKAIVFYDIIVENVKKRYDRTKSYRHRKFISSLICSYDLIRRYRLGQYAKKMFGFTSYQLKTANTDNPLGRRTTIKSTRIKQAVTQFLERDDNSRLRADKKATITRNRQKKQIRLLTDDMKHLHAKYIAEGSNRKISYSLFCKLRPFWIRAPTYKDRDTCLCKLHENLQYKLERAYVENMYSSRRIEDLAKTITCDRKLDDKRCMYRECPQCNQRKLPLREDTIELGKQVTWKIWKNRSVEVTKTAQSGESVTKTSTRIVKDTEQGTLETLNNEANEDMQRICRHIFNIRHQYRALTYLKENLQEDDILLHIDFSENYLCKYDKEIQSVHFGASQRQISIHTGIAYTLTDTIPFATISDCLQHSPSGIWAHIDPVLDYMNETYHQFKTIHFLSDGPTTQYRNRQNFYIFSTHIFKKGFTKGTWNFLEAGHGKGAADGVGAVIKRTADKMVETNGHDITCAEDLARELQQTKVKIFVVKEEEIENMAKNIISGIAAVPKTMRIHQVLVNEPAILFSRELSCFCKLPGQTDCGCFGPVKTVLHTDINQVNPETVSGGQSPADSSPCQSHPSETPAEASSCATRISPDTEQVLQPIDTVDESLIDQYCVVIYDDIPYPGRVLDVDENDLQVQVMHKVSPKVPNKYFWPLIPDICWYHQDKVITMLKSPPENVSKRHLKICDKLWEIIECNL